MITHPYVYFLILGLLAVMALLLAKNRHPLFHFVPPIVLLYLSVMLLASNGIFSDSKAITYSYKTLSSNLLPAMIFLMLLPHRPTRFIQLGKKMILSFFFTTLSLFFAFVLVFIAFHLTLKDLEVFAPLAGSWMGGTANMLAVSAAINAHESALGITMLIDSVNYALWVMFLLLIVPLAPLFNRFSKASSSQEALVEHQACALHFSYRGYAYLLLSALLISLFSQLIALQLSSHLGGATSMWSVLLATLSGMLFSYSPLAKIRGLGATANAMLYLLVALIASRSTLEYDNTLLSYILMGSLVLFIHAIIMIMVAKLFRLDLFSISVASLSHIGGIASAPILSAAYSQSLVGIGVIMATMGYLIGTLVPLFLVEVLRWLM